MVIFDIAKIFFQNREIQYFMGGKCNISYIFKQQLVKWWCAIIIIIVIIISRSMNPDIIRLSTIF